MLILICLIAAIVAVGTALVVTMIRRDEPLFGMYAMLALTAAGLMSAVYGTLASA